MADWDSFFHGLSSFILITASQESQASPSTAEYVLERISNQLHVVSEIKTVLEVSNGGDQDLLAVLAAVTSLYDDLQVFTNTGPLLRQVGAVISSYHKKNTQ